MLFFSFPLLFEVLSVGLCVGLCCFLLLVLLSFKYFKCFSCSHRHGQAPVGGECFPRVFVLGRHNGLPLRLLFVTSCRYRRSRG